MSAATAETEHFSTVGELNPLLVLERFGDAPVALCMIAVETRDGMRGCLEEKGRWVHSFWDAALLALPEAAGCRLLWNSLFFALPSLSMAQTAERLGPLLQAQQDSCLESLCVWCEVAGKPEHKLDVLDVLQHEVGGDFGANLSYRPNGHRFYHLRDGWPYSIK